MQAALFIGPVVIVAVLVVYVAATHTSHHYTSMLTSSRWGRTFAYDWVPLASSSAFRLGAERYLQCTLCNEWSTFDIRKIRVASEKAAAPKE